MDFMLNEYTDSAETPIIDYAISDEGELDLLNTKAEEQQRVIVAAFTQRGTIPQMPESGVQWAEYLTQQISASELNSQIMKAIQDCGGSFAYRPEYTTLNGKLLVRIVEA